MSNPSWSPEPARRQAANISRFMELVRNELDPGISEYRDLHRFSIEHPGRFWQSVWAFCEIAGDPGTTAVTDFDKMPGAKWFPDARLNFAENLLRYRDDHTAILFKSETEGTTEISYRELYKTVAKTAAALKAQGVQTGDRVAGYLPNLPETVIAMLAAVTSHPISSTSSRPI